MFTKWLLLWKSNKYDIFSVCGSLSYPACKAHVPNYSHMAYLDLPCFPTLSHKQLNFHKIVTEHKMCVSIFSITFVSNISHCKKNLARYYHKYTCLHVKYPFLSDFNESWHVLKKILKHQIYWKSIQHYFVHCLTAFSNIRHVPSMHCMKQNCTNPKPTLHIIFHILVIHFCFSVE